MSVFPERIASPALVVELNKLGGTRKGETTEGEPDDTGRHAAAAADNDPSLSLFDELPFRIVTIESIEKDLLEPIRAEIFPVRQ